MKKNNQILIIILICISSLHSYSQSHYISVIGGLNLSKFSISDGASVSKITGGGHLGVLFGSYWNDIFVVETGFLVTSKGGRSDSSFAGNTLKRVTDILNIEFPILFKAIYDINDEVNIFASAGGYLGYSLAGLTRTTSDYSGQIENTSDRIDFLQEGINRLDYGLTFGVGIDIESLLIGVSYDLGLSDLNEQGAIVVRNRVLKLSLGYRIG